MNIAPVAMREDSGFKQAIQAGSSTLIERDGKSARERDACGQILLTIVFHDHVPTKARVISDVAVHEIRFCVTSPVAYRNGLCTQPCKIYFERSAPTLFELPTSGGGNARWTKLRQAF